MAVRQTFEVAVCSPRSYGGLHRSATSGGARRDYRTAGEAAKAIVCTLNAHSYELRKGINKSRSKKAQTEQASLLGIPWVLRAKILSALALRQGVLGLARCMLSGGAGMGESVLVSKRPPAVALRVW